MSPVSRLPRSPAVAFRWLLLGCSLLLPGFAAAAAEDSWPREFGRNGRSVLVYEPQVEDWSADGRLQLRAPVAVTPARGEPARYGVLGIASPTEVDAGSQSVLLGAPEVNAQFPDLPADEAARLQALVREALPAGRPLTLALPTLIAAGGRPPAAAAPEVAVDLDPPPIFHSTRPATLLMFYGPPAFEPVGDSPLQAATNTESTVLYEPDAQRYWLALEDGWLTAPDLRAGPWTQPASLSPAFRSLPADAWGALTARGPGPRMTRAPAVIYSERPAELIVTDGPPRYVPVAGTRLEAIANTDSPVFVLPGARRHYFLTAGRWFTAPTLAGPWQPATTDLPPDFTQIPPNGPYGWVLASVPGTPAAAEAVALAGVPRKSTVPRQGLRYAPVYEGPPRYEPIDGTGGVDWIVNTPYEVVRYEDRYYGVDDGVWFVADEPGGPWYPAERVPGAIYRIPPAHPLYHVTYVRIYGHTPETVTYGYTPGYTGQYVSNGVLMFGVGALVGWALADRGDRHPDYIPYRPWYRPAQPWRAYGYGAVYRPGKGFAPRGWAWGRYRPKPLPVAWTGHEKRWARSPLLIEQRRVTTTTVLSAGAAARTRVVELPGTPFAGGDRYRRWGGRSPALDERWQQARRFEAARPAPAKLRRQGPMFVGQDGALYRRSARDDWQRVAGDGRSIPVDRALATRQIAAPAKGPGARGSDALRRGQALVPAQNPADRPDRPDRADRPDRGPDRREPGPARFEAGRGGADPQRRDEAGAQAPAVREPGARPDRDPSGRDAPPDRRQEAAPRSPDRDARARAQAPDDRPDSPARDGRPQPRPEAGSPERPQATGRDERPQPRSEARPPERPQPRAEARPPERPQPAVRVDRPQPRAEVRPPERPQPRAEARPSERPQPAARVERPQPRPEARPPERPQPAARAERPQPRQAPPPPARVERPRPEARQAAPAPQPGGGGGGGGKGHGGREDKGKG